MTEEPRLKKREGERRQGRGKAVNSLKAYAAGIRPSGNLGEAGLTNPSHGSSPPTGPGVHTVLDTKLLRLTRFQVISPPPHSRSRQDETGSGLKPPSGVRKNG